MTSYAEMAHELGFGDDFEGFRTWADMHDVTATDEVDDETAQMLREAHAGQPEGPVDTALENRREDAVLQELYEIAEHAGYDEDHQI